MGGKLDIAKGRIEEAAGVLAGNANLKNKGKVDQAVGNIKLNAAKVTERIIKRVRP